LTHHSSSPAELEQAKKIVKYGQISMSHMYDSIEIDHERFCFMKPVMTVTLPHSDSSQT
jgi:hypothetical protein